MSASVRWASGRTSGFSSCAVDQAIAESTNFRIAADGIAPAWRATSLPFRNTIMVGIAVTRKREDNPGSSSVFTFVTRNRPEASRATFTNSGATILHGPHQGAQKSTRTGKAERLVNASKTASLARSTGSAGGLNSVLHLPQRKVFPSASYFMRLHLPQFG